MLSLLLAFATQVAPVVEAPADPAATAPVMAPELSTPPPERMKKAEAKYPVQLPKPPLPRPAPDAAIQGVIAGTVGVVGTAAVGAGVIGGLASANNANFNLVLAVLFALPVVDLAVVAGTAMLWDNTEPFDGLVMGACSGIGLFAAGLAGVMIGGRFGEGFDSIGTAAIGGAVGVAVGSVGGAVVGSLLRVRGVE